MSDRGRGSSSSYYSTNKRPLYDDQGGPPPPVGGGAPSGGRGAGDPADSYNYRGSSAGAIDDGYPGASAGARGGGGARYDPSIGGGRGAGGWAGPPVDEDIPPVHDDRRRRVALDPSPPPRDYGGIPSVAAGGASYGASSAYDGGAGGDWDRDRSYRSSGSGGGYAGGGAGYGGVGGNRANYDRDDYDRPVSNVSNYDRDNVNSYRGGSATNYDRDSYDRDNYGAVGSTATTGGAGAANYRDTYPGRGSAGSDPYGDVGGRGGRDYPASSAEYGAGGGGGAARDYGARDYGTSGARDYAGGARDYPVGGSSRDYGVGGGVRGDYPVGSGGGRDYPVASGRDYPVSAAGAGRDYPVGTGVGSDGRDYPVAGGVRDYGGAGGMRDAGRGGRGGDDYIRNGVPRDSFDGGGRGIVDGSGVDRGTGWRDVDRGRGADSYNRSGVPLGDYHGGGRPVSEVGSAALPLAAADRSGFGDVDYPGRRPGGGYGGQDDYNRPGVGAGAGAGSGSYYGSGGGGGGRGGAFGPSEGGSVVGGVDRGRPGGAYGGGGGGNDNGNRYDSGRGAALASGGGRGFGGGRDSRQGSFSKQRFRSPDLTNLTEVKTNIILTSVSEKFSFYQYSVNSTDSTGKLIDSRSRRQELFEIGFWNGWLKDLDSRDKEDLKRCLYFAGSFFFSCRKIPILDHSTFPIELVGPDQSEGDCMQIVGFSHFGAPVELSSGDAAPKQHPEDPRQVSFDTYRCSGCSRSFVAKEGLMMHCRDSGHSPVYDGGEEPAQASVFISYINLALHRALTEKLARWGPHFVDPASGVEARDSRGNELGVSIFKAYDCVFTLIRPDNADVRVALTFDLKAKVIRNKSMLEAMYNGRHPSGEFTLREQEQLRAEWIGQTVIYKTDKKTYTVTDLLFNHSAVSLPIPGKDISHAEYFGKKGQALKFPDARPMIEVLNRRDLKIFLPPELITADELDPRIREQLPRVASFMPDEINQAMEKVKAFLVPGGQGGKALLPALGLFVNNEQLRAKVTVMAAPDIFLQGIQVPRHKSENWTNELGKAKFNIEPSRATTMNVFLVYHYDLNPERVAFVYNKIRDMVNAHETHFRFSANASLIEAGDNEKHWGIVQKYFGGSLPDNVFVLDFAKPRGKFDPAYHVVKRMLSANGYLSQFLNFRRHGHDGQLDRRKSDTILQGVARQILHKAGEQLWWASIPRELPMPAVFIGIDVFHAPVVYDPELKQRSRKRSCAAIIVQVFRTNSYSAPASDRFELHSRTFKREGGEEYDLQDALTETLAESMRKLDVLPASVVVWRDGISETSFERSALKEIQGVRRALDEVSGPSRTIPIAYVVCQKRIRTKFLTLDGQHGAPAGTLVTGLPGLNHRTYYINGKAPPFSTPKPVRYIVVELDPELQDVPLEMLTWGQCHNYPNWAGAIKVPSQCQMAHKLAELGGGMTDCGDSIDSDRYLNCVYFL